MEANSEDKKLEWMYKGANSLVDREEYLLGRRIDKTLEQLNAEEKHHNYLAPPKNHVEHECIPPSIREFNKIVYAEQVDLSAKLQEDPLVAIKKHEEDTRRQFLQNPVQLKKLQKALEAQQAKKLKKKKKKVKRSKSDKVVLENLDDVITKKLHFLRENPHSNSTLPFEKDNVAKKKSKSENYLDTILLHKYSQLKDHISESDLQNIVNNFEESEDDSDCTSSSSDSEFEQPSMRSSGHKTSKQHKNSKDKRRSSSPSSDEKSKVSSKLNEKSSRDCKQSTSKKRSTHNATQDYKNRNDDKHYKRFRKKQKRDSSEDSEKDLKGKDYSKSKKRHERKSSKNRSKHKSDKKNISSSDSSDSSSSDNKKKVSLKKKKHKRSRSITSDSSSDSSSTESHMSSNSDSKNYKRDSKKYKDVGNYRNSYNGKARDGNASERKIEHKNYGLVKSDGTKIELKNDTADFEKHNKNKEIESKTSYKPKRSNVKKLSEEEKEKLRKEMMDNAQWREIERSKNVKIFRELDKKEAKEQKFEPEFIHRELMKSAGNSSLENRIKSNLNNIQRTSEHMNKNFSKRN